ncbi:MAG TPA: FG-GAP-like repeat-containing protein [Gaiellaceae bacterium]|nr:FG-GAP-like repeat-containing protein [Gaiellaceae bacterium]
MTRLASVAAAVLAIVVFVPGAASSPARVSLQNVATQVGLDFRQGAFRFGVSADPVSMMGSGLCWLDYDRDGWIDLFVVNSYSDADALRWQQRGGLPRSALFHNVKGKFVDVTRRSGAGLAIRGTGCVAADLDSDGDSDLYVTAAGTSALLWNAGKGRFREGAAAAGVAASGWRTSAAVGDVDGDGRPDLYVGGYTDVNAPIPGSSAGFPGDHLGVRDLLYLNLGRGRFREIGRQAGLEAARFDHTLGAAFSDLDRDGRLDLYVANDEDPNRLYENVAWPGGKSTDPAGLGFRFEERAGGAGAADPNAGMGVAIADADGDGIADLFVTNSRGQQHAVLNGVPAARNGASFADGRAGFAAAFGRSFTGWGVTWADLDLDGDPDLLLANGSIPVRNLTRDAQPVQVLENRAAQGAPRQFTDAAASSGVSALPLVVGRGLAAADYDNDGRLDFAINSVGGRLMLLKGAATTGNWLEVALEGFHPGARVTAVLPDGRRLVRELQAGSSYLSSEDPRVHFGLGQATGVAELTVRYPSGRETRLANVASNRVVTVADEPWRLTGCVPDLRGRSVARVWDEAVLDAIRRDLPAPTTHARNLFHVSAAMWDAWAAYERTADGYFVREKVGAVDVQAARETAISYAAYRVLLWRYAQGAGLQTTFDALTGTLTSLCLSPEFASTKGDSPAALGNRIAAAVIKAGLEDGSLERQHYADTSYRAVNEPLIVAQSGAAMHDPVFWQPLALDQIIAQNGLAVPGRVQSFIGAGWGHVKSFALPVSRKRLPIDPGKPPFGTADSASYKQAAVDVIRLSGELDPLDGQLMDIGPGARGDNPLGTNDGNGYDVNPVTGKPYAPNLVRRSDFGRVVAEFWADGPSSETPPGHWNVLANVVSDSPLLAARIGAGAASRLKWDVRLYLALNGAVHDAAIAAWGIKREYNAVRPISMIRYLAAQGQSTDPRAPSYSRDGLPLVPGLIELVTAASSAPGERHAALSAHIGEIAIRTWRGKNGVGWGLGADWVPYQRPTFVTPAFPGFISGHSTFSRAAAEVLTGLTGSPYFPGGLFEQTFGPGYLKFEQGPVAPVKLQSATYYDAADQAGVSRLFGGIHVPADDFAGRRVGSIVGKRAWALAQRYFDGSAHR